MNERESTSGIRHLLMLAFVHGLVFSAFLSTRAVRRGGGGSRCGLRDNDAVRVALKAFLRSEQKLSLLQGLDTSRGRTCHLQRYWRVRVFPCAETPAIVLDARL